MKLSRKTSIIITTIGVLLWSALFVIFYAGPHEYGHYSEIDFGSVRGASVTRFRLTGDDAVLESKKGQGAQQNDVLLLVRRGMSTTTQAIIVRDNEQLVFEKNLESGDYEAFWMNDVERFEIKNISNNKRFLLIPGEYTYIFERAP
ncbi:hypothetical protein BK004_01170 [bacterium CG10_46_32]|nr:MAG: hypothetical protein BK004_01170 [bacterium CG10_46_32]PIR56309.1 MAG: hypothetical protein COU73_01185 [Parcubacteria group bacterium CG10_big_fil_rev_8_21_14_0_10_46_32]